MARLDFSPAVVGYLERHAVDPELAYGLGVRSDRDAIVYPYTTPRGESYTRRRDLADERKVTKQPSGEPLILWWPAGRPAAGADVLLTEGEPDALAALSALDGHPVAVAALPGTEIPADRVTANWRLPRPSTWRWTVTRRDARRPIVSLARCSSSQA